MYSISNGSVSSTATGSSSTIGGSIDSSVEDSSTTSTIGSVSIIGSGDGSS